MFTLTTTLINELDEIDTEVQVTSNNVLTLSVESPRGKDCNIEIQLEDDDTLNDVANKIFEYYYAFDVSYEAYLWLDEFGHGKNGAPYEMEDVLDDAKWEDEWILRVYNIFIN